MMVPEDAKLLRVFFGEDDRANGKPLYEALLLLARERGLAGGTILRGPAGFGHASHLHTAKILRLSQDLPMVAEFVDAEDKIRDFIAAAEPLLGSALVTLEAAQVIRYGPAAGEQR